MRRKNTASTLQFKTYLSPNTWVRRLNPAAAAAVGRYRDPRLEGGWRDLLLQVADNGAGMDSERLASVLERYSDG
ncbi:hypothetical protein HQN90_26665 [Paenibacillus alba]|uniref:hypothetical protein n=1 Tax=Paenibacillus alba TaxID=1197127 RepID=UPI001566DC9E|nr:hypothetical protein [Paenibacillus alba]NQX69720.1 hypothetical protein [Paenibacillus alba]